MNVRMEQILEAELFCSVGGLWVGVFGEAMVGFTVAWRIILQFPRALFHTFLDSACSAQLQTSDGSIRQAQTKKVADAAVEVSFAALELTNTCQASFQIDPNRKCTDPNRCSRQQNLA